ncbi:uncharacterized protein si:dkey-172o19.2 [Solea solea]|uniref:uncharacterized protein si:dkey-172o19.2 n=1 Tax=Solea solea TaxID=90069 RepID=UPI00272A111F|nr:uncharacterized protein si:dkey-172o19.2 [Solea solea]
MSTLTSPGASCQTSSSSLVDSSSVTEPLAAQPGLLLSVTGSSPLRLRTCSRPVRRRKRTMTPMYKKDSTYWDKRRKNNEAARRSRERRRLNDLMMEGQLLALNEENAQLRAHLSLQYHTSVSAGRSKAASPVGATFTSPVVAPLSLSPRNPAYSRAGHWVNGGDATASILSVRHQDNRPCETDVSCFGTTEADGVFKGATASLQGLRSAEAEMGPQRRITFSDDNFTQNYYIQAFLRAPADTPRHACTNKPNSWLESHLSSSAVYNNLLLPWWSSYTPPPTTLYSCLPPYRLSCAGPGLHLSADGR